MIHVTATFTGYSLHRLPRLYERKFGCLMADVQAAVATYFHIRLADMTSKRRDREVARPRQVAMYLCRESLGRSLPEIGRRFGNRDHTTVLHAVRTVNRLRMENADFAHDLHTVETIVQGMGG